MPKNGNYLLTLKGLREPVRTRVREENPSGSVTFKTVPDGEVLGDVEVYLDHSMLRWLAGRALKASRKRAQVGNGVLICKAKNVKRVPA